MKWQERGLWEDWRRLVCMIFSSYFHSFGLPYEIFHEGRHFGLGFPKSVRRNIVLNVWDFSFVCFTLSLMACCLDCYLMSVWDKMNLVWVFIEMVWRKMKWPKDAVIDLLPRSLVLYCPASYLAIRVHNEVNSFLFTKNWYEEGKRNESRKMMRLKSNFNFTALVSFRGPSSTQRRRP